MLLLWKLVGLRPGRNWLLYINCADRMSALQNGWALTNSKLQVDEL